MAKRAERLLLGVLLVGSMFIIAPVAHLWTQPAAQSQGPHTGTTASRPSGSDAPEPHVLLGPGGAPAVGQSDSGTPGGPQVVSNPPLAQTGLDVTGNNAGLSPGPNTKASGLASSSLPVIGSSWADIGPKSIGNALNQFTWGTAPFSGRVTAIAVNNTNPSIIYVGGAQGGIWKSANSGKTWTPIGDSFPSLAIGAVTISSDGKTIYVGTGEPNHSGDSYYGAGLLKSTDGGKSWSVLGASDFAGSAISSILISPSNPSDLLVSTTYAECCDSLAGTENPAGVGIFQSTDGGATWSLVLSTSYGVADMVADPNHPNVAYAGDELGAVWQTADGGSSWTESLHYTSSADQGRVAVALSGSIHNAIFAAFADQNGALLGIFEYNVTTDVTTQLGVPPDPTEGSNLTPCGGVGSTQCGYDFVLAVDPTNPDDLYFGGVDLYLSTDRGSTWTDLGGYSASAPLHPDQHSLAFSPTSPGTIYSGDDGGLWSSTDYGNSWTDLNSGLEITQFSSIAASPTSDSLAIGGTQDNACVEYSGTSAWNELTSGDGGWTGIESTNPNVMYCDHTNLDVQKSTDGGLTWADATTGINLGDSSLFYAPVAQDPSNPGTLYIGGTHVYKTTNFATSWSDVSGSVGSSEISALAVAPSNSAVVYLGDISGDIKVSTDGGSTWVTTATEGMPISRIAVNSTNYRIAYAAVAEYATPVLLKTTDGGASWQSLALAGFPQASINVVKVDPSGGSLLVGTDDGVFSTSDGGTTWYKLGNGLPNAAVFDIAIAPSGNVLAATHGRGVWVITPTSPPTARTLTIDYSIQGGGTGYSAPLLTYVSDGVQRTATLTETPTSYSLDPNTAWSVTNPLTGSSTSERWDTSQATSGTITASQTVALVFYHQVLVSFSYDVVGGGSGYSDPQMTYSQFGSRTTAGTGTSVWADASSSYSYPSQLTGSTPSERWATNTPSGTVSSPTTVSTSYYHQYGCTCSYSVSGGGTPTAPTLTGTEFGSASADVLSTTPTTVWQDSSGSYSTTNPTTGSTSTERWDTSTSSGTVSGAFAFAPSYHHQYLLTTPTGSVQSMTSPSFSGEVGWYDSGTAVTVNYDSVWNVIPQQSRLAATGYAVDGGGVTSVPEAENGTFAVSVTMDSPHAVAVESATQYFTSFGFTNASGSETIAPTDLQISVNGQTRNVQGFSAWLNNGTKFAIEKLTYEGVDVKPQTQYSVTGPAKVTVNALVYDVTLKVSDVLGLAVSGADVKLTLANGTVISGTTGGDGTYVAQNIPLGTFSGSVSSLGSTSQVEGDASAQSSVAVSVLLSTASLGLVVLVVVIAAGAAAYMLRRRSKGKSHPSAN